MEILKETVQHSDNLELVRLLQSRECQLLKTGYTPQMMSYFFCSCDVDHKEPICEDCYNVCHAEHVKKEVITYKINAVCSCGSRCHRINSDSNVPDHFYKRVCMFMDWSTTSKSSVFYQHNQSGNNYCMFCANFCHNKASLTKRSFPPAEKMECGCSSDVHHNVKFIYEKLIMLRNLEECDFEHFTPTQILNMITFPEESFSNTFNTLMQYLCKLSKDLETDPSFELDNIIGYSSPMKALETFSVLSDSCHSFHYFNNCFDGVLSWKFLFNLLEKKFDLKSGKNIWNLKYHVLNIFNNMIVKRDFESIQVLSIKDIENLHPLQRLLHVRTIESQGNLYQQYFAYLKFNPLDKIINIIERLKAVNEQQEVVYEIMAKCYEICLIYASFHQFTKEQIVRFCTVNDEVISGLIVDKKILPHVLLRSQMRMMSPMVKTVLYLVYYHNDEMLERFLKNQKDISKLNFFHSNSEIGSIINKNCINIINYVRYTKKSLVNQEITTSTHKDLKNLQNETKELKTFDNLRKVCETPKIVKEEIEKLTRKILLQATTITSIAINYPDNYLVCFRRLMHKNNELYMNYLHRDQLYLTQSEKSFVQQVRICRDELEEVYSNFFNFEAKEETVVDTVKRVIKNFFENPEISDYKIPEEVTPIAGYSEIEANREQDEVLFNKRTLVKHKSQLDAVASNFPSTEDIQLKFRMLLNSTFFIPSLIKSIKIMMHVKEFKLKQSGSSDITSITLDEEWLDGVVKLLYFYIHDNPDNCMMIFASEVVDTFLLLHKSHVLKVLDLIHYAILVVLKNNIEMNSMTTIIRLLRRFVIKISGDPSSLFLVGKVLRIISELTELNFHDQEYMYKKLRNFLIDLFDKNPILTVFKNYLLSAENFPKFEIRKNSLMPIERQSKYYLNDVITRQNKETLNKIVKISNEKTGGNPDSDILSDLNGFSVLDLFEIYVNFLRMVNFHFDGNATLNERPFLSRILDYKDFPSLLQKKSLNLSLRTEILVFFRMSNIDVIIDPTKLDDYRSLFVNQIKLPEDVALFEDSHNFKFFNDLLYLNENSFYLDLESALIKHELKFFQTVLENSQSDQSVVLNYFQQGIILPLYTFLNKFMAIINNLKGYEYLNLYEIVIYFLKLKKFLIDNRITHNNIPSFELKTIFKSYALQQKRKNYSILSKDFKRHDLLVIKIDLEELTKPNFEILNYRYIYSFFEKHVEGFIHKLKSKSLKKVFEKRDFHYDKEKLKKMDTELKVMGLLKTPLDKNIFDAIVKYENDKNKFWESAFVQNLGEQNIQVDSNYRSIILKTVLFMLNDNKLADKYRKQCFWHLFKLLQFDTVATQTELYSLYAESKTYSNLPNIVDLFLQNLLSLIFTSSNPTPTVMNEDYYLAINIVKILKYLCEEHNINFQTIFFQELKFDVKYQEEKSLVRSDKSQDRGQVSLFDLFLGIIGKVVVLSKWDKVNFDTSENSITYFYDIFFVMIELLIETVQGTSQENLETIVSTNEAFHPFINFLRGVKLLLLKDENDSAVLYRVRKDIIDFLVAFLEEKATPKKVINMISSVFNPYTVFETIVNNLKKLYFKKTYPNEPHKVREYHQEIFDDKKCQYFMSTYFSDLEFCKSPEFEFSNRLYQYVKLLASQFHHEDAIKIIESINTIDEKKLSELHFKKQGESQHGELIVEDAYVQNYFAVKFFEKITRSVTVQKDDDEVTVLFTLNPLVPMLSKSTKTDFFDNVNRESRYIKLYSLMEYNDYFFNEVIYNSRKLRDNSFLKFLNMINYYLVECILFLFCLVKNIILLVKLDSYEYDNNFAITYPIVKAISITEVILNGLYVIAWFISKFPLYYTIETKKYSRKHKIAPENLSLWQKTKILLNNTIMQKNEINGFLWNIIFSGIGLSAPENTFLFAIQLLILINLSVTLKNIIKSVTMRHQQLLAIAMFIVMMVYVFTNIAFFFLHDDFVITFGGGGHRMRMLAGAAASSSSHSADGITDIVTGGNQENQCGSLLDCFLTHLDHGLRTDGGMGEHLRKISYNTNNGYYVGRFFYELLFYIINIVILFFILFGIIIDTFAELGEELHHIDQDKKTKCFICGAKQEQLEKNCVNYKRHVSYDHNIWTYVEYMIGLKFVDPQETNAINSHVIEMIELKSISWFPSAQLDKEEKHH